MAWKEKKPYERKQSRNDAWKKMAKQPSVLIPKWCCKEYEPTDTMGKVNVLLQAWTCKCFLSTQAERCIEPKIAKNGFHNVESNDKGVHGHSYLQAMGTHCCVGCYILVGKKR